MDLSVKYFDVMLLQPFSFRVSVFHFILSHFCVLMLNYSSDLPQNLQLSISLRDERVQCLFTSQFQSLSYTIPDVSPCAWSTLHILQHKYELECIYMENRIKMQQHFISLKCMHKFWFLMNFHDFSAHNNYIFIEKFGWASVN